MALIGKIMVIVLSAWIISLLIFALVLGILAHRLGRDWIRWVTWTIITSIIIWSIGPLVAYPQMRKLVNEAGKSDRPGK
jgi:MFS family permease